MDVLSIITIIFGFSMLLIGLSVWIGKVPDLIAGYDPEKTEDPERLAQTVGIGLTVMGFIVISLGLVGELLGISEAPLIGLIFVPAIGAIALAVIARRM